MKPTTVHVHSFVDLITNSSTEIYINATEETVKTTKKIINAILSAAQSDKTCDDLFDIKIAEVEAEYDETKKDIIIVPRDGVKIREDIVALMRGAFDIEASYDG